MSDLKRRIAGYLLECRAVMIDPENPFTWASGWRSPIYCDNRVTLSYPEIRKQIRDAFIHQVRDHFRSSGMVAGVATGAIAQGALVADSLNLPFVYVRASPKEHGRKNQVEGSLDKDTKVVVVEDLVSTGGSSLGAVRTLREAGAEVTGMVAVFSYGFQVAEERFRKEDVKLVTLTDYQTLVEMAVARGVLAREEADVLAEWRNDPSNWGK